MFMPRFPKELTVYFYRIEPLQGAKPDRQFIRGAFPLEEVLNRIDATDPSSEESRIPETLFGGETFCVLHDDGPTPVLGAYYRDNFSMPLAELKGEVKELILREGEAIVDSAYVAFFPGDVVGLVRTSSKAPGFAKIGNWISMVGGYSLALAALTDSNTMLQLEENPNLLRRLSLRIQPSRISLIEPKSTGLSGALRAAADVSLTTEEVAIELRGPARQSASEQWSKQAMQEVREILEVLPDFEEAKVKLKGKKKEINLLRANVQTPVTILLEDTKVVGPNEAAKALVQAYEQEELSIQSALKFGG